MNGALANKSSSSSEYISIAWQPPSYRPAGANLVKKIKRITITHESWKEVIWNSFFDYVGRCLNLTKL